MSCPIEFRSSRGYCPEDWQGHLDEVCGFEEYADAPFCAGPSLKECADGTEVPEDQACVVFEHEQETREGSCELDGTCDDSCTPPARDDCLVTETAEPAPPNTGQSTLPETGAGADAGLLLASALALITIGTRLARQRLEH